MHIATLDTTVLDLLRQVDSATLANAIERLEVRDRSSGYLGGRARCHFPNLDVSVGRALTVTMTNRQGPPGSREGFWELWQRLDELPGPSMVVVQDASGEPDRVAYWGEIMATMASQLGAIGLVTDGGVRDLDEVRALGFQYFSPYAVVSHGNFEIVSVGDPVEIFGERIHTGDVLHGDINGVVVVPDVELASLSDAVTAIREREGDLLAYVRGPDFSVEGTRQRSGY